MPRQIRPSRACVELVKAFEGYRRRAAQAPDGAWTLGYGHTASARAGVEVDKADAEALLLYDLHRTAGQVAAVAFAPLTQNQADALVAFAFNIGPENFAHSTVLERLNQGDALGAAHALERWRQAAWNGGDLVIDALVRRRAAEKALFLTPPDGFPPAPSPVLRPLFDPNGADPIDARARAAEVHVALDAPLAAPAGLEEPPVLTSEALKEGAHEPAAEAAPATQAAASALSARLAAIAPDPLTPLAGDEEPAPFPLAEAPPASPAWTSQVQTQGVDAQALEPEPLEPEAPPFPSAPPAASLETEPPAGVFPHPVAPEPAAAEPEPAPHPVFAEETRPTVEEARGATRSGWIIGLVGLVLFGLAIASMLGGRATALNLALGLAGVFALAYAGAELVLPWLNRPPRDGA